MKKLVFFILMIFSQLNSQGQIVFSREYGGTYDEDGRWMEQMPDSGFILTGGTTTYGNGSSDIWLVRTDAYGNVMWDKTFGDASFDFAKMVKPLSDGFIICGLTARNGNDDGYLVKADLSGNLVWEKIIGDAGTQSFEAIVHTTDNGFAALGVNTTGTHGGYDMYLVKFDAAGIIQWQKNIGGGSYDIGNSLQQTADGGYILTGQSYSYGGIDGDFILIKTDAAGNVQWQQNYSRPHEQDAHYVQKTPDGGYIMVGDADTLVNGFGDADLWLVKTDSLGNLEWDRVYGGAKKDGGKTVENTTDGGYIVGGITRSYSTNPKYFLVKTDSQGLLEWQANSYGSIYHNHAYRAIQTSDGGYAEFGYFKNSFNYENFALVKLGPDGGVNKDIGIDNIIAPKSTLCRSNNVGISVQLTNYGQTNEQDIKVYLSIDNGLQITTLVDSFAGSLAPALSTVIHFGQTYDFNVDGDYILSAHIEHRNSDISYTNDTINFIVKVIPPTLDPVTTSGLTCSGGTLTLTAVPASPADSMFWYDATLNGNLVSAGNSFVTPPVSATTTYYVQSVKGTGNKVGVPNNAVGSGTNTNTGFLRFDCRNPFKLVSVKVYTYTAGIRTIELRNSAGTVLQSVTLDLPLAPGGIRVYLNFDVPRLDDLQLGLSATSVNLYGNTGGAVYPFSISQTVEIYGSSSASVGAYFYFYDWYIFVPSQDCASNMTPVQAVAGSGAVSAFDRQRCGSGNLLLTANAPGVIEWYNSPVAGTLLYTGNTFTTPVLSNTTTYYVQAGSCSGRVPVLASVNPVSATPVAIDVTHCGPGSVTLTASASDSVSWYNVAPPNGTVLTSGTTFTTPFLNTTTTYFAVAGIACPSTPVAVQAIINSANAPVVTGATACGPASVTLTATTPDPVRWYDVPTGGTPIASTATFTTPVLASSTVYYVEAVTSCPSQRIAATAYIIVASSPVGTDGTRCGSGSVVISAQSIHPVSWWSMQSGGVQLGTGSLFTTPVINTSTVYYAQSTVNGCNSIRTPVHANVNVTPAPAATAGVGCGQGQVSVSATASDTIYWYDAATGGSLLGTGSNYLTPLISNTTTYFAHAGSVCPSVRTPVIAYIVSQVADPVATGDAACKNGPLTLIASSLYPITWYDAPAGNALGIGNSFTTPAITNTTTYYAVAGSPGCMSNPVAAIALINPLPADPLPTHSGNCGPGLQTLSAGSVNTLSWFDMPVGGNLLHTGSSYVDTFNTSTTVYVEADDGNCISNRIPVTASVYTPPTINIGPPNISIVSGASVVLNAGPGYISYLWNTTAATQAITINTAGVYYVTVQDNNGCFGSDTITVSLITGVYETTNQLNVEIYPNPSDGIFQLKVENISQPVNIQLSDITGKIIFTESYNRINSFTKNYDLTGLAKGVYILQMESGQRISKKKLIIQ